VGGPEVGGAGGGKKLAVRSCPAPSHQPYTTPELELIQTQMTQKPMLRAEVGMGNARALRKQSKCGAIHEGEGHWPKSSQGLKKARHSWVARTPQK